MLGVTKPGNVMETPRTLLQRLRTDTSGNTLSIIAAAMVPLAGLVGSGIDLGRVYATRTRLQHACDAAVLAGRKAMKGEVWDAAAQNVANTFFRNNFQQDKYGTLSSGVTFSADKSKLSAVATATVPMSLMQIFGYKKNDLVTNCTADLNMPNSDIMMVLDTTGSMDLTNPGDTESRIKTLRKSVTSFYDSISAATTSGANIRFGFVPYSSTVNVGSLLKPEWIADSWTYQSRVPDGVETVNNAGGTSTSTSSDSWELVSGSVTETSEMLPIEACTDGPSNVTTNYTELSRTDTPYAGPPAGTETIRWVQAVQNGDQYWLEQSPTSCKRWKRTYNAYTTKWRERTIPVEYGPTTADVYWWSYQPVTYNTSTLTVGGSIKSQTGAQHTNRDIFWNGCIEERSTTHKANYSPIPNDALDMDIDLVPTNDPKTQWGPSLPALEWTRRSGWDWDVNKFRYQWDTQNYADWASGAYGACPSPSRKLAKIGAAELQTYLDSLIPMGNTYHDIGMVWGARLLSPTGLFASENGGPGIARHLIFMTDGETSTSPVDYDAYGISALDRRRAADKTKLPTKEEGDAEVEKRFAALCDATRNKNIVIWVIAFGTDLSDMLKNCADPGKAFQANNSAELNKAFADIAAKITQLRLVD